MPFPFKALMLLSAAFVFSTPVWADQREPSRPTGQTYLQPVSTRTSMLTGDALNSTYAAQATQLSNQPLLDALRKAYVSNPTLRAARAELRAAAQILPMAQSGWMPLANANGSVTAADIDPGRTGDGTTSTVLGASLTQPLYRGGRTVSGIDSAESRIKAQSAILDATEQQLLLNVATAYMNVVRDRALLNLSENNITVVNRQFDASRNRFEVGDVTKTDVAQSQARLARAQASRTTAIGNLKSSLAVADKNNPLIAASNYLHQSAEKDIGVVFGELLPELGLSANIEKNWDP